MKSLHTSTEEDYDGIMGINVRSAFLVCRRTAENGASGGGSVVITASIASELGYALEFALLHVQRCGPSTGRQSQWNIAIRPFVATRSAPGLSNPMACAKLRNSMTLAKHGRTAI